MCEKRKRERVISCYRLMCPGVKSVERVSEKEIESTVALLVQASFLYTLKILTEI